MRIYTKTGDAGETALFGGQRVKKDAVRVEAYGCVDELNACLGIARVHATDLEIDGLLHQIQALLFTLGAELATPPDPDTRRRARIPALPDSHVTDMEGHIDRFEAELPALKTFILPAGNALSCTLHVARAVCRRAERRCVHLQNVEPGLPIACVTLLNRLSDLLFVLARLANHRGGVVETAWHASG